MLARIGLTAKTVLWREDTDKIHPIGNEHIHEVFVAHHRGMICQNSHALTAEFCNVLLGALGANYNLLARRCNFLCRLTSKRDKRKYNYKDVFHLISI